MFHPPFDATFILAQTHVVCASLIPEIPLHLLDPKSTLGKMTEEDLESSPFGNPYWAIAWSGSQAIARYILDNPDQIVERSVLDFASGCALSAIAAAQCGAAHVMANDIDPICQYATQLNAGLNKVTVGFSASNLLESPPPKVDIILAGDVCYEEPLATVVIDWLESAVENGTRVFLGDPGRTFLPRSRQRVLQRYQCETIEPWEDTDVTRACVREVTSSKK
ncbi:MAG: methyltransferase [Deltaproteobacteria bacterium]|nr:methyltransferase [Deltaproteobacteria bacterium]